MHHVTVVIATRDRWSTLDRTLHRLSELPDMPPVIVVDNASVDGTPQRVRRAFPAVTLVALPANLGAAARTIGARLAVTRYVAFADDDSWWDEGALGLAAALMAAEPSIALVAARVLVGEAARLDPTSALMADGPLDAWHRARPDGRRGITGFLACGAVVRREAFLAVGGFNPYLIVGGEEELVALDLADSGWKLVYEPGVVARHHPSPARSVRDRQRLLIRNGLLNAWLRYSPSGVIRRDWAALKAARRENLWSALGAAATLGPWALAHRRPVDREVERTFDTLPV